MFHGVLLSSQVKRSAVISNKHAIYELPHELTNDLTLRISGNQERSGTTQKFIDLSPSAQSFSKNKNFVDTSKKPLKNKN